MGDEDAADLEDLAAKIERLEEAVRRLREPYVELAGYVDRLQEIARSYFRLLDILDRYGALSPDLALPGLKDPISKEIVKVLFAEGSRNISQITASVRRRLGSASRRIVRDRLHELEEEGVVTSRRTTRETTYDITAATARRWAEVLGLVAPSSEDE